MRPHPITVALALVGIGITVTIFFMQAMRVELSPLGLRIGLGVGISCIVVAVAVFVYGLCRPRVEGALSRKARRQLRGLRREIRGIVRLFKRWEDPGPPSDVPAPEQYVGVADTHGQLEEWAHSMRRWCREYRPQAEVIFWNPPKDKAKLELAEYYAEQIDQVRSEATKERATGGRLKLTADRLGELHNRGLRLADGLSRHSLIISPDARQTITTWSGEVYLYLRDNPDLGPSCSSHFINDAAFPGDVLPEENVAALQQAWATAVRQRCNNLDDLITGLRQRRGPA